MPGKFATEADEFIWTLSLSGCDDTMGDVQFGSGWFGYVELGHMLGDDEAATLGALGVTAKAAILNEDSQGFVEVSYFDTLDEAEAEWGRLADQHSDEVDAAEV